MQFTLALCICVGLLAVLLRYIFEAGARVHDHPEIDDYSMNRIARLSLQIQFSHDSNALRALQALIEKHTFCIVHACMSYNCHDFH